MRLYLLCIFLPILLFYQKSYSQYTLEPSGQPIIDQRTKDKIGTSLSLTELNQLIREISQDGLFQVLSIEKIDNRRVRIRAQKTYKIHTIQLTGNSSFTPEEIKSHLPIKEGKTYTRIDIQQAVEKLRSHYKESGFYNFNISETIHETENGSNLMIEISENKNCQIKELDFFSNNEFLNKELRLITTEFIGQNYTQTTSDEIEKKIVAYLETNRYLVSKISNTNNQFNDDKTQVKLRFTITKPLQFELVFHGNQFFSHFDLLKASQSNGKFLYLNNSSSEIIESIIKLYQNAGFPYVQVSYKENQIDKLAKRVLLFDIVEGARVRIGKIDIQGKLTREKSYYTSLFENYLGEQSHTHYYVKDNINSAADQMISHLKREGYLMADLISMNVEINPRQEAQIIIQVDEGILTYVRQILFRGSKSFSNIELKDVVQLEANKPLILSQIEVSFDRLIQFYKEAGFLEFQIKNADSSVIQYQRGQPYADIVYQINEGPKIKVQSIRVAGLKKTKEYVVLRELDFDIGEYLNLSKVTQSIERLEKTGLFGKVNIRSLEQGSPQSERTILIDLEERKPGLFSSGVGLLNEGRLTYRGYVGALYNNLGGKGRGISSRADVRYQEGVNYVENRLALSYYEPYLMKTRLRGRVSLVREQELSEFIQDNSVILSTNEVRFSTEKEITTKVRFTYNVWRFANQETFAVRNYQTIQNINIGSTGPILEWDFRNDPFLPTKGSYSRFEFEYSDPILGSSRDNPSVTGTSGLGRRNDTRNEINYYKTHFSTTHYTPLTDNKRWVWANSVRGGYLKNISSRNDSGVPRVRSFFLGGSSTIRGFSIGTTETVPGKRELCLKQGLIGSGDPTSSCRFDDVFVRDDSTFFLVKSELRFPLSGNLGGLVFYDGGAVYMGEFRLDDPYRDSVGVGLRYDTPVGAFVIEIGYKLDRKLGGASSMYDRESDVAFHLAIGNF